MYEPLFFILLCAGALGAIAGYRHGYANGKRAGGARVAAAERGDPPLPVDDLLERVVISEMSRAEIAGFHVRDADLFLARRVARRVHTILGAGLAVESVEAESVEPVSN